MLVNHAAMEVKISFLTIETDNVASATCEFLLVTIDVLVVKACTGMAIIDDIDTESLTLN